jgi:hypothetical protein
MTRTHTALLFLALGACGDNLTEPGVDACGAANLDAGVPVDAETDAALDCRLPPCGQAEPAWTAWAAACFLPGECRLIWCPAMGDNLVHVCRKE